MSKHLSQAIRGQESTRLGNSLETSLAAGMGSNTDAAQSKKSKLNSDPPPEVVYNCADITSDGAGQQC